MSLENQSFENTFKQKIQQIREYISKFFRSKKDKIQQKTKNDLLDNLNSKPNKLKELFSKLNPFKFLNSQSEPQAKNKYEDHTKDSDDYVPQDAEMGEAVGEQSRFAEIYPGYKGYFVGGRCSYFDPNTNLWSKNKELREFDLQVNKTKNKYTYTGIGVQGLVNIHLPAGCLPDINSLHYSGKSAPIFLVDQFNCLYLHSQEKQYVSFNFYAEQTLPANNPIEQDSEKLIFKTLSNQTQTLLNGLIGNNNLSGAYQIQKHILSTKTYEINQGTLRNKSNKTNYLSNLDNAESLDCYGANTLMVALCRQIGLNARLVLGQLVQSLDKDGKSLLSSNNGHAWCEVWDDSTQEWIRFDATSSKKKDGSDSEQNGDLGGQGGGEKQESDKSPSKKKDGSDSEQNEDSGGQGGGKKQEADKSLSNKEDGSDSGKNEDSRGQDRGEKQQADPNSSALPQRGTQQQQGSKAQSGDKQTSQPSKNPKELLEEFLEKAKEDNLAKQAEQIQKTLDELEKAESKEDIRKILDKSGLKDFAKEMIDELGNNEILQQEKKELESQTDEKEIDKMLENSLLDENFKEKLNDYGKKIKKQIEDEKKKLKTELERLGFREEELNLYKQYKELEAELMPEVKKQIRILEKILPPVYKTHVNENEYYASGTQLGNTGKLIEYELIKDPKIFRRNFESKDSSVLNMFETIIIDRSGSMGSFENKNSPLRQAIKSAIIRAKVLEHFKVNFSIILFDSEMEQVMDFGEKFSEKRVNNVPSRLMRAVQKTGSTDIGKPMSFTFDLMKQFSKKTGKKSFGNISFLGDGQPCAGLTGAALKGLIGQIRAAGYGVTAFYINQSGFSNDGLQEYFGTQESGGTLIVGNVSQLTDELIGTYNKNLKTIIKKYSNN